MKKRKSIIAVLLVLGMVAAGAGAYFAYFAKAEAADSSQQIVLEEGQKVLYAKISSISGNEMDYAVVAEQTIDSVEPRGSKGSNGKEQDTQMIPLMDREEDAQMPQTAPPDNRDMQNRQMISYAETGESGHLQIPVGTDVETKLGTITTFSRLSNGDIIRLLMQKTDDGGEELLKIWIVE